MIQPLLRSLFDHMAWADAKVIESLRTTPGHDAHALEQFGHVLGAEHVWLRRLQGRAPTVAIWPTLTVDECTSLAEANRQGFDDLLARSDDASLVSEVDYVNSVGRAFRNRIVDILLHVAMHGTYHRGMISILTRRSDGVPAPTDFIAFIRGAPTATRTGALPGAGTG
jgi:uncharacterized damage-inducible protein DinB